LGGPDAAAGISRLAGGDDPENGTEGDAAMTETPLREVRRAVYRPVREGNALEDTVARLVQTIRLGVVAPGESLPAERELATLYAVSRDTVREAIRELADTGYLDDVLGLRRVLEAGAARAAASRSLDADKRDELWARYEAVAAASAPDYRRLDTLLHLAIAEIAGIPSLVALAAENRAQVNAWLDTFPLLPRNIEHANAQHEHIVTAILAGRADAAEAAVLDHLAGTEALLRGFLS
jgi:DNA-binding FadR family transcriptional regulator